MYHCLVLFPFLSILSNSNLRCFSSVLSFTLCTLQQQVISLDLGKALVVSGEKKGILHCLLSSGTEDSPAHRQIASIPTLNRDVYAFSVKFYLTKKSYVNKNS